MSEQIKQMVQAMGTLMTIMMGFGIVKPVMLQEEVTKKRTRSLGGNVMPQGDYYWVICDYEKKEFWGMLHPLPSVDGAIRAAKDYIKQKRFPVGGVYAIEVYSQLPKILGRGTPLKREFIEVE